MMEQLLPRLLIWTILYSAEILTKLKSVVLLQECQWKAAARGVAGNKIRSGYSANAEIVLAQANNVLSVPESAIEFQGNATYVYVVKVKGKDKTYERRRVVTGLSDGINIQIKSGITLKDKIRGPKKVADTPEESEDKQ